MHAESDSGGTSIDVSWATRSPSRRPFYYVQSPSNPDVEKISYGSSPMASPTYNNYHYHQCSSFNHSRESSTSRFLVSGNIPRTLSGWKHEQIGHGDDDNDEEDDDGRSNSNNVRLLYAFCLVLVLLLVFAVVVLIGWDASKRYEPEIFVKAGNDESGVPTDMLSLNSTVTISYRNLAASYTFHVTSTPLELHHFQLKLASGKMEEFTQPIKSDRIVKTIVAGHQVPLYGGILVLVDTRPHLNRISVPLNLTFMVKSRTYIMGTMVKTKFYGGFICSFTFKGNKLGESLNLTDSCIYQ
ncbi:hypothetical protein CXB51_004220 [Gossypium anomalum]|uniref:Late embryogenesis abundant protein LEA-2 subgroup domain-containing protein n=1 Tax=Gossypium anomalum TaxID=47600 RepID=A0A8J5ZNL0_9ROSI|nr:hypothetical protein CXB51_004220 [Gossypium anomalum]